ncbi:MAG: hypothetical protein KGJ78_04720 [Alphaproteobacteria bacterium]|nr:hypothetical protein [Alphaproteobacteria bacterium]
MDRQYGTTAPLGKRWRSPRYGIGSEKQRVVYRRFDKRKELAVAKIHALLKGAVPLPAVKQALSRPVALKLLERIGQGRGTRYGRAAGGAGRG